MNVETTVQIQAANLPIAIKMRRSNVVTIKDLQEARARQWQMQWYTTATRHQK